MRPVQLRPGPVIQLTLNKFNPLQPQRSNKT